MDAEAVLRNSGNEATTMNIPTPLSGALAAMTGLKPPSRPPRDRHCSSA
ncbi:MULTISPECIES: hypothetical protein [Streptomyces]|nr:hypothetical protein [Streptomyces sp. or20]